MPATGNIIKNLKQSELDGCHTHELDLAFTWPTERQIWEENGKVQFNFAPSQVTLCPWFVKWASNQPIKVCSSFPGLPSRGDE